MVSENYKAYMKSPSWQRKRQAVFNTYGKRCYACKTYRGPIQVHHLTYARLGRELLSDLRPLCWRCHKEVTALHWKMGKRLSGKVVFATFMKMKGHVPTNKKRK